MAEPTTPSVRGATDSSDKHAVEQQFPTTKQEPAKKTAVRHAEKRRQSTCLFADRVAQLCVSQYRAFIPASFRETQKQTCMAAIVAHDQNNGTLHVLGMGVGTKFLSQAIVEEEASSASYGTRVRDCHAEVLARRAVRRYLLLEISSQQQQQQAVQSSTGNPTILQRHANNDNNGGYRLKPGVTLHMYTSSAPCGNATLKKFATMKKECFRDDLNSDEWPSSPHEPIQGHSIALGQFALLVKKDPASTAKQNTTTNNPIESSNTADNEPNKRPKTTAIKNENLPKTNWPAHQSTDWCPPGTSTVWAEEGSLHTCSDKLCRWNCLGLQGSLLAALLVEPIYMSSLVVGRKLTASTCRRAVCCRAAVTENKKQKKKPQQSQDNHGMADVAPADETNSYRVHHPAIMGTAVYMDEHGVIDMAHPVTGQDVRFHSTLSWAWWPQLGNHDVESNYSGDGQAECIDGATGFSLVPSLETMTAEDQPTTATKFQQVVSRVSTSALTDLYMKVHMAGESATAVTPTATPGTLSELRTFKWKASPLYEAQKERLMTEHRLFRQWKRRALGNRRTELS